MEQPTYMLLTSRTTVVAHASVWNWCTGNFGGMLTICNTASHYRPINSCTLLKERSLRLGAGLPFQLEPKERPEHEQSQCFKSQVLLCIYDQALGAIRAASTRGTVFRS